MASKLNGIGVVIQAASVGLGYVETQIKDVADRFSLLADYASSFQS